jgi:hypothetical protein
MFGISARVHSETLFGEIFASTWERPNEIRFNLKGSEPKMMNK